MLVLDPFAVVQHSRARVLLSMFTLCWTKAHELIHVKIMLIFPHIWEIYRSFPLML